MSSPIAITPALRPCLRKKYSAMNRPFWSHRRRLSEPSCESVEPLLPLYADGMATPDEMRFVEAHLPACADCRAALSWIQATHSALASRPIAAPPPDLHSRIAQAIAASSAAPGTLGASVPFASPLRPARSFTRRSAYAAAASLTALGIAVSFPLWHLSPHSAAKPAPPVLTASSTAPPAHLPAKPMPQHAAPLIASTGQKPKPGARAVPLTRQSLPMTMPHEAAVPQESGVPQETVVPQEQVASTLPAPHPAATMRVNLPRRSPAAARSLVASASRIPAEKRLPIVPDAAPKTAAPKISDTPLVAKQDAPVTVAPAIVTADPPVKTASLPRSEDFLGPVNAAAKAMRTVAFGSTSLTKRQVYSGVASTVQSLDSNHVAVYNAIYSGTAEK